MGRILDAISWFVILRWLFFSRCGRCLLLGGITGAMYPIGRELYYWCLDPYNHQYYTTPPMVGHYAVVIMFLVWLPTWAVLEFHAYCTKKAERKEQMDSERTRQQELAILGAHSTEEVEALGITIIEHQKAVKEIVLKSYYAELAQLNQWRNDEDDPMDRDRYEKLRRELEQKIENYSAEKDYNIKRLEKGDTDFTYTSSLFWWWDGGMKRRTTNDERQT